MRYWTPIAKLAIGIPTRTLQDWCAKGKVTAKKLGAKWYVHLPDLNKQFAILDRETRETRETED